MKNEGRSRGPEIGTVSNRLSLSLYLLAGAAPRRRPPLYSTAQNPSPLSTLSLYFGVYLSVWRFDMDGWKNIRANNCC